jgi:hypothetical protein
MAGFRAGMQVMVRHLAASAIYLEDNSKTDS